METEAGIVAPSFSQGQEAGFEANDFGMDNFPGDEEFAMDDDYEEDSMGTENTDVNFPGIGAAGDACLKSGQNIDSSAPKRSADPNYTPHTFKGTLGNVDSNYVPRTFGTKSSNVDANYAPRTVGKTKLGNAYANYVPHTFEPKTGTVDANYDHSSGTKSGTLSQKGNGAKIAHDDNLGLEDYAMDNEYAETYDQNDMNFNDQDYEGEEYGENDQPEASKGQVYSENDHGHGYVGQGYSENEQGQGYDDQVYDESGQGYGETSQGYAGQVYDDTGQGYSGQGYDDTGEGYSAHGYNESIQVHGYKGDMTYDKQPEAGTAERVEGYYPPEEDYFDQYDPEETNEEQGEEEELEEEEEEEEEGEDSEEESEDEDVNEALNSLADFDATDLGMEGEGSERLDTPEPAPADTVPGTSEQTTEDSLDKPEKKKRKRKKKGDHVGEEGNKPKRKRKKKGENDESSDKKKADNSARKNIRKILSENKLEQETLDAQAAELERQRRLSELKKQQLASLLHVSPDQAQKKEKDSQLKSLLQGGGDSLFDEPTCAAEDNAEKETEEIKIEKKEEKKEHKARKEGIIDISSAEEDDDVVMVNSEEEEEDMSDEDYAEAEDMNNSGSHINDSYNVTDDKGRVLVNVGHPTSDPDIYLSNLIAKHIKPHQIGGVRFLYDNLVECVNRFKTSAGFGCILAHSMGLGKTIQMIGFMDIFLRHTGAKRVMVIVPINTLANWMAEFNMWVPDRETCEKYNIPMEHTEPRAYPVYMLNDNYKNTPARAKVVDTWYQTGGVLLLGYEMYRLLSSKKVHLQKASKGRKKAPGVIDVDEEDRDKKLLMNINEALVNPGPDLVVCDEGHRIKNAHAGISQSLKQIKTKRRIVLTGYPLQNNLIEYWCMVDFIRPNFLGTKTEFCNMFERPIMNGQCADSTPQDVRLMRYRAHVLHSLLEGFVQRRGHTVLQAALPPKEEYVFMIRMSTIQKKLYEKFMESITDQASNGWVNNNPLKAFSVCCKIWNHPDILYKCMKKSLDDNDLDIETGEPKKKGGRKGKKDTPPATPNPDSGGSPMMPGGSPIMPGGFPGQGPMLNVGRQNEPSITYDWANEILKDYVPGMLDNGGKMVMLFNLIQQSLIAGDKILVFSQSLFTLNMIEEFLSKCKVPRPELDEFWSRNKNYFRLDGSTSSSEREKLINQFNNEANKWVFLLSTRAGSLGINLIGANRVVVVDASWNPCHDCQAICRVYRFGQVKPSYIYRFVTENTMERKIYDRQVNKQGMSDRVVDELNPQNQFRREHVDKLMYHENKEFPPMDFSGIDDECNDDCMITVLKAHGQWLTAKPFTHESLLIDRKELKLTMKEKRLAKQSYVMEKRLNVSYSRPSYAAYYPRGGTPYHGTIRGRGGAIQRPIASVKPMISTPVPMRPKIVAAPQILKPGVSVHQVLTTTEIVLPGTNTSTEAGTTEPKKIPAGQQVLVIRTPKGVYIRTPDGKIFAVRSKPQPDSTSPLDTLANTGSSISTGGLTMVRPTTTTTMSSGSATSKLPAGVTVIRAKPNTITTTKPLTIIRQGPGQVRTIIPVTIGSKITTGGGHMGSTTAGQMAIISAQSQKVPGTPFTQLTGSKIRIVTPNTSTSNSTGTKVSSLAALQNLSECKKIISHSPAFSGGSTIVKTVIPKTQPLIKDMKTILLPTTASASAALEASKEQHLDRKSETSVPTSTVATVNKELSWNLPPIDMKALKLPQQLSGVQSTDNKKVEQSLSSLKTKPVNKSVKPDVGKSQSQTELNKRQNKPKFSLTGSPSDSNQSGSQSPVTEMMNTGSTHAAMSQTGMLSTRPSDIDLHEMRLSSSQNSSQDVSQMMPTRHASQQQTDWLGNLGNQSYSNSNNQNQSGNPQNVGFQQQIPRAQKSASSQSSSGIFNPGLPNMTSTTEMKQISSASALGHTQTSTHGQVFSNNQTSQNVYGDFGGTGFMNTQGSGRNAGSNFGTQNSTFQDQSASFGNQNSGFNSGNDNMADFTMSGIHNNSSFLSELTDADDNFLSQLDAAGSDQNSQTSMDGSQIVNQSASTQSGSMASSANLAMPTHSQGGMNFDMFSNQQQQNQNFFPNFSGNNQFGSQQNMNMSQQGGFPGGSMYPMMQPSMFPYPAFAPYPYAPMMAPMPYYPVPFQPQYGGQGANIGQQTGNIGQQGTNMGQPGASISKPMSQQGDNNFQSGMGNL